MWPVRPRRWVELAAVEDPVSKAARSAAQQRVQGGRLRGNELSLMKRSRVLDLTGYPAAVWMPPRDDTSAVMYAHERGMISLSLVFTQLYA